MRKPSDVSMRAALCKEYLGISAPCETDSRQACAWSCSVIGF